MGAAGERTFHGEYLREETMDLHKSIDISSWFLFLEAHSPNKLMWNVEYVAFKQNYTSVITPGMRHWKQ